MIPRISLIHCQRLIEDISKINENDAEDIMPYVLRSAIILYSAEMEDCLKRLVTIALKHYPFVIKGISVDQIREFLKNFNNKSRNPSFTDIQNLIKIFDVNLNDTLQPEEKQFYSDFIGKRNKIAHNPRISITFSFDDFKKAVVLGETILNKISESLFLKVTEHIKEEFL